MSEHLNRVSKQFIRLKTTKSRIKKRHSVELTELAQPDLVLLGKEISAARSAGFKVDEIMAVMGLKNRNFLYDALRAYTSSELAESDEPVEQPADGIPDDLAVSVEKIGDSKVRASIGTEIYELTVAQGGIITNMPEEWLRSLGAARKQAVREVIKQTQGLWSSDS